MRVIILAVGCLVMVCSSSVAQDEASQDQESGVPRFIERQQRLQETGVNMLYVGPFIVRAGQHTLIFPFAAVGSGWVDPTVTIPFLLAVKHEGNAIVELSLSWTSPSPVTIATADAVVTAKMLRVKREPDGKPFDRPKNAYREEMHFITDEMTADESLNFALQKGRVFVISFDEATRKIGVRQPQIVMFDPEAIPPDTGRWESICRNIAETVSWWKKAKHSEMKASSGRGSRTTERAGSCPSQKLHPTVSQPKQPIPESSVAEDDASPDQKSAVPRFIEGRRLHTTGGETDFRGPFVVRTGQYTLVFPIAKGGNNWEEDTIGLEETIPFVLAVKHEKNAPVISTIQFWVSSPGTISTGGELVIGEMPPVYVKHMYNDVYNEEMYFRADEMRSDESVYFDLQKGRVFVISIDEGTKQTRVRQLQGEMFDPKTVPPGNRLESTRKKVAGVVSWWKKAKLSEMKANSGREPRIIERPGSKNRE